ncbi:hypothetical protein J14TS2_00650 [Bacillus sp. J14TS2]|nr:hypothetical protein J14TS2_00650 [Bacillus sp. J14TS2]
MTALSYLVDIFRYVFTKKLPTFHLELTIRVYIVSVRQIERGDVFNITVEYLLEESEKDVSWEVNDMNIVGRGGNK